MANLLDASALLAILQGEAITADPASLLTDASISAVNYSEVIHKLVQKGVPADLAISHIGRLQLTIIPFDIAEAQVAGSLAPYSRPYNLSFADRACIATGTVHERTVWTADSVWSNLPLGCNILLIR